MRTLVAAVAASLAFGISGEAAATITSERSAQAELHALAQKVAHHRRATWRCQDALGTPRTRASVPVSALPPSIPYRKWVVKHWRAKNASCGVALKRRTIPATADWVTAVYLVQRVHPGTKDWLLSCSGGEGGHGGFKMNNQGSPAGGQMQFYRSTYEAWNDTAFAHARSKGFVINERSNSWFNPLGQALTAAYMRTHGGSSNWDPRIDPACR